MKREFKLVIFPSPGVQYYFIVFFYEDFSWLAGWTFQGRHSSRLDQALRFPNRVMLSTVNFFFFTAQYTRCAKQLFGSKQSRYSL
jgi:hypothetical protein